MAKRSGVKPVESAPAPEVVEVPNAPAVEADEAPAVPTESPVVDVVVEVAPTFTPSATETPVTSAVPTMAVSDVASALNLIVVTEKNGWQVVVDQDTNMVMLKETDGFNQLIIGIIEQPLHTLTEQSIKVVALSMWVGFYKKLP